jgi:hypothetical protein
MNQMTNKISVYTNIMCVVCLATIGYGCTIKPAENRKENNLVSGDSIVLDFIINFNKISYPGEVLLKPKRLCFKFRIPDQIVVSSAEFFLNDATIKLPIFMTCALTDHYEVLRCSTSPEVMEAQELFISEGWYIIGFIAEEDFNLDDIHKVRLTLTTSFGESEVTIIFPHRY